MNNRQVQTDVLGVTSHRVHFVVVEVVVLVELGVIQSFAFFFSFFLFSLGISADSLNGLVWRPSLNTRCA